LAYLRQLLRGSRAVASDLVARAAGTAGVAAVATIVAVAAITSANATLLLGSRLAWAFGRDHAAFSALGRWSGRARTPVAAVMTPVTAPAAGPSHRSCVRLTGGSPNATSPVTA
jgi:amino acid transporter